MRPWFKYALLMDGKEKYLATANWIAKDDKSKNILSKRNQTYYDFLIPYINKSNKILSIGSGYCELESFLEKGDFIITATDIDKENIQDIQKIYPNLNYEFYNPTEDPYKEKSDIIMAFSFFYNFNEKELDLLIGNIKKSLNEKGRVIIDIGGGENNLLTLLIDLLQKIEVVLYFIYLKLLRKEVEIIKKNNGYRNKNKEIISIFRKNGFELEKIDSFDTLSELGSRTSTGRFFSRINIFSKLFQKIGGICPYIRLMVFTI